MAKVIGVLATLIFCLSCPAGARASGTTPGPAPDFAGEAHRDQVLVRGQSIAPATKAKKSGTGKPVLKPACETFHNGEMVPAGTCITPTVLCLDPERPRPFWNMVAIDRTLNSTGDDFAADGVVVCLSEADAPKPTVTEREFRRLPIPAPQIAAQPDPARGHTLINIDTNFYISPEAVTLNTTVLGQPVRVRATPSSYRWSYGDGAGLTTSNPGAAYPNMITPHIFREPGTFTVSLTTTFVGEFSASGGPWQPIEGTATATSTTIQVTAEERRAVLIG